MNTSSRPKQVLITGCSSGIGLALVHAFLDRGWEVIATARQPEKRPALRNLKHPCLELLPLDLMLASDRLAVVACIKERELDCLVNNAGFGLLGPFEEQTEEDIRAQMEVNFFGAVFLTQACLPALRRTQGRIINISSALGYVGMPLQSLYVASKYALEGFSESLFFELQPHKVQVCLVEPGLCRTEFGHNAIFSVPDRHLEVYARQRQGFINLRQQLKKQSVLSPEKVAREILNLVLRPQMPLRLRLGKDASLVYYLRRLLPVPFFMYVAKSVLASRLKE